MKRNNTQVFRAPTFAEAIGKATAELGKDIMLVERRRVRPQGKAGILSKLCSGKLGDGEMVEVEVALPEKEAPKTAEAEKKPSPLLAKTYARALEGVSRRAGGGSPHPPPNIGETASAGLAARLEKLAAGLESQRRASESMRGDLLAMLSLQARGGLPMVGPELLAEYRRLTELDIREELARDLVENAQGQAAGENPVDFRECLGRAVAKRISLAGPVLLRPEKSTVVALVGPTGVGKSTTIAKLAVEFTLRRKKTVGLINEDTRRPGAEGQLRNLAMLMSITMASADEPAKIRDAVKAMAGTDLILLDTAGRSPRDAEGLEELGAVLRAAGADETHLVLSAGSSEKTFFETISRFRRIGFDRLIMTKLDETVTHGEILNVASRMAEGLSYVTTGQKYMESLVSADRDALARLILGWSEVTESGLRERPRPTGDERA